MAKSILIVDDNPNMSSLLAEMLEIFDYKSIMACDGEDALRKLEEKKISLVITDMRMPNMTGMELIEVVRVKYPKIPIVLISGYTVDESENKDKKIQPDGFLAKPFMMSDIEELLNSLL